MKNAAVLICALLIISLFASVASADAYSDRVKELKDHGMTNTLKRSINEKAKFVNNVSGNAWIKTDKKTDIAATVENGKLKFKDTPGKHDIYTLQVSYTALLPYIVDNRVRIEHKTDAGVTDAVWTQRVINDNGFVYLESLPFSEIIVGGFTGSYTKTSTVSYSTNANQTAGNTFNASNVSSIIANVTVAYTETGPYDVPPDGLVAWYRFDEGSGTNIIDHSGNNNNGTATGMTYVDGKYNGAGYFSGDDYATIADTENISNFTTGMTVIAIFNLTSGNDSQAILQKSGSENYFGSYNLRVYTGALRYGVRSGSSNVDVTFNGIPTTGRSHLIAGIWNGTVISAWYDGAYSSSQYNIASIENSNEPLQFGKREASGFMYLNGSIDSVLIYNRALTEGELRRLYYDSVDSLQFKTNSNTTLSTALNGNGSVAVPFISTDLTITGVTASVPSEVTLNGVTVREYQNTVSPFALSTIYGYTEDTTKIDESHGEGLHKLNLSYTPSTSGSGRLNYTTDSMNVTLQGLVSISSDADPSATVLYNQTIKQFTVTTGVLASGSTYDYAVQVEYTNVPVANFIMGGSTGYAPLTVQFNDTSLEVPTSWLWNFGDGETSAEQNPSHTYSAASNYTVSLTVANPAGNDIETKVGCVYVEVAPIPETVIMKTEANGIWSDGVAIMAVVIAVLLTMVIVGLLQGNSIAPANISEIVIGLMIVMLIITVGYGTLSSMSGLI